MASELSLLALELWGSLWVVLLTCSPGPFVSVYAGWQWHVEWAIHLVAIVAADYFCGGPRVNPAATVAFCAWGQSSLASASARVAGQMIGGVVGYTLLRAAVEHFGLPFLGPAIAEGTTLGAALASEGIANFLLMLAICCFALTRVGETYLLKQPLIAASIRAIICLCGASGPAINPMLATSYHMVNTGEWPDARHWLVYWGAACAGMCFAACLWSALGRVRAKPTAKATSA